MNPDQQVRAALRVLQPEAGDREQCRERIAHALASIDFSIKVADTWGSPLSKGDKSKLKTFRQALKRVDAARKVLPQWMAWLRDLDVEQRLASCDVVLEQRSRPQQRYALKQRRAAEAAKRLMELYGQPVLKSRHSPWVRLAAILYGDPNVNLFHYCRELRSEPGARFSQF